MVETKNQDKLAQSTKHKPDITLDKPIVYSTKKNLKFDFFTYQNPTKDVEFEAIVEASFDEDENTNYKPQEEDDD